MTLPARFGRLLIAYVLGSIALCVMVGDVHPVIFGMAIVGAIAALPSLIPLMEGDREMHVWEWVVLLALVVIGIANLSYYLSGWSYCQIYLSH